MKYIVTIIMLLCLQIGLPMNTFGEQTTSADLTLILMDRAAAKDIKGLIKLQDRAVSSNNNRFAYHLARFIADPKGYAEVYITEFPSTSVMGEVYTLELSKRKDGRQVTPYFLYSIDQLGKLAIDGNPQAIAKFFNVKLYSGGVVSEYVCERIAKVISGKTDLALESLSKLQESQRKRIYSCFGSSSGDEIKNMKSSIEKNLAKKHIELKQEILTALKNAY